MSSFQYTALISTFCTLYFHQTTDISVSKRLCHLTVSICFKFSYRPDLIKTSINQLAKWPFVTELGFSLYDSMSLKSQYILFFSKENHPNFE